jgi:hypothetical protein
MRDPKDFTFTLTDADLRKLHLLTATLQAASRVDQHLRRRAADDVYTHAVQAFHYAAQHLDA